MPSPKYKTLEKLFNPNFNSYTDMDGRKFRIVTYTPIKEISWFVIITATQLSCNYKGT